MKPAKNSPAAPALFPAGLPVFVPAAGTQPRCVTHAPQDSRLRAIVSDTRAEAP